MPLSTVVSKHCSWCIVTKTGLASFKPYLMSPPNRGHDKNRALIYTAASLVLSVVTVLDPLASIFQTSFSSCIGFSGCPSRSLCICC